MSYRRHDMRHRGGNRTRRQTLSRKTPARAAAFHLVDNCWSMLKHAIVFKVIAKAERWQQHGRLHESESQQLNRATAGKGKQKHQ